MYYQNYEDYMRSVLGYPMETQELYQEEKVIPYQNTKELEDCYPQIYKVVNPIVCEMYDRYSQTICRDNLEDIVEQIYQKIEMNNNDISIKINIENREEKQNDNRIENRNTTLRNGSSRNINDSKRENREVENRQRNTRNPFLQDIIRILLLNKLLGNNFPNRPPRPRPPMRPPYPGGPRSPRREIDEFSDYYRD